MIEKPIEVAARIKNELALDADAEMLIHEELSAQRLAPPADAKTASKSLTIRAAVANAVMPILALKIAQWGGMSAEQAWELAASLFVLLSSLVAIGMRRAWGLA